MEFPDEEEVFFPGRGPRQEHPDPAGGTARKKREKLEWRGREGEGTILTRPSNPSKGIEMMSLLEQSASKERKD